ncbi:MAG: PDZ domain-containing protein [Armatimonadetes bacterium]|nr:PDZ domain-containing protein [Armatimonadota bacterium]
MKKFILKILSYFLIIIIFLALLYFIPLPYVFTASGGTKTLSDIVEINGKKQKLKGKFILTTVYTDKAYHLFNPQSEISKFSGNDNKVWRNKKGYEKYMDEMMKESKTTAILTAFKEAGYKINYKRNGVKILFILPESKAKNILKEEDLILKADNREIKTSRDLVNYIIKLRSGDEVRLLIKRTNHLYNFKVPLISLERRSALGIFINSALEVKRFPLDVFINTKNINGSSAGLMFALEIFSKLKSQDLTFGRIIAGSGTIDENGKVGEVAGIKYKIWGAQKQKAQVFLLPYKNFPEAGGITSGMQYVPVRNFKEALKKLKNL